MNENEIATKLAEMFPGNTKAERLSLIDNATWAEVSEWFGCSLDEAPAVADKAYALVRAED